MEITNTRCRPSLRRLILLCFLTLSFTAAAQFEKLVVKADPAIFQIQLYNRFGNRAGRATGFFTSADGLAMTSFGVLDRQRFGIAQLSDGRSFTIEKVTRENEDCDAIEFKVITRGEKVPFLPITKQVPPKGAQCMSMNLVEGFRNSLGIGVISGFLEQYDGSMKIQTNIPSAGNGGGPLMNVNGEVFGVMNYNESGQAPYSYAYPLICSDGLMQPEEFSQLGSQDIYFLNQHFPNEEKVQLNSVEFIDSTIFLHITHRDFGFYKRGRSFIWVGVGDTINTFRLVDQQTGKSYFADFCTLGSSRADPTWIRSGERVEFSLAFKGVPPGIKCFDLIENMPGGDWSMYNIRLGKKGFMSVTELEESKKIHTDEVLTAVFREEYRFAYRLYQRFARMYADDLNWQRLGAFVCLQYDEPDEGLELIVKALENGGGSMDDYMKLGFFCEELEKYDSARMAFTKAIEVMPSFREAYMFRAKLCIKQEDWREALADLNRYFAQAGDAEADDYFYTKRGYVKAKLGDKTACADFEKAKELAADAQAYDKIQQIAQPFCKGKKN